DRARQETRPRLTARAARPGAPDGRHLRDPRRGDPRLRLRGPVRLRAPCAGPTDARLPRRALPRVDVDRAHVLGPAVRPQAAEVAAPADDADADLLGRARPADPRGPGARVGRAVPGRTDEDPTGGRAPPVRGVAGGDRGRARVRSGA